MLTLMLDLLFVDSMKFMFSFYTTNETVDKLHKIFNRSNSKHISHLFNKLFCSIVSCFYR